MFKFAKSNRILKKLEFKQVFDGGSKVVCRQLVVYAIPSNKKTGDSSSSATTSEQQSRIGLVVSRKVGGAITRNKVKRRLREAFRHLLPDLPKNPGLDFVVIARHNAGQATYTQISGGLHTSLNRLSKRAKSERKPNVLRQL